MLSFSYPVLKFNDQDVLSAIICLKVNNQEPKAIELLAKQRWWSQRKRYIGKQEMDLQIVHVQVEPFFLLKNYACALRITANEQTRYHVEILITIKLLNGWKVKDFSSDKNQVEIINENQQKLTIISSLNLINPSPESSELVFATNKSKNVIKNTFYKKAYEFESIRFDFVK